MITNHHWGSTTSVGGSGADLRFTPYNVPLLDLNQAVNFRLKTPIKANRFSQK